MRFFKLILCHFAFMSFLKFALCLFCATAINFISSLCFCFSPQEVVNLIEKLIQSGVAISYDETLEITFTIIKAPAGRGPAAKRKYKNDWGGWKASHTGHGSCFIQIQNKDNLCLARALVVAKAKVDKDPKWLSIK